MYALALVYTNKIIINYQLSIINYQLSIINYQLSIINYQLKILSDLRVNLLSAFDRNFQRKAFFTQRWLPRRNPNARGTLLLATGALRRSIKAKVQATGILFTSALPYAQAHNKGVNQTVTVRNHFRTHRRTGKRYAVSSFQRKMKLPQRQFVGDSPQTRQIIEQTITKQLQQINQQITQNLKQ